MPFWNDLVDGLERPLIQNGFVHLPEKPGLGMDEAFTGIHVTREKTNVFTDVQTRDAFAHQWAYFAKRYKGIRSEKLSFNLVNEPLNLNGPAEITKLTIAGKNADDARTEIATRFAQQYGEVARSAIDAIRKQDPDRLIVTDGLQGGNQIIPGLFDSHVYYAVDMPVGCYANNTSAIEAAIPKIPLRIDARTVRESPGEVLQEGPAIFMQRRRLL